MRAYQCDRCGALYSHSNKLENEIFITGSCTVTGQVKDLCDECQKELEIWWNVGKTEESEEQNENR